LQVAANHIVVSKNGSTCFSVRQSKRVTPANQNATAAMHGA